MISMGPLMFVLAVMAGVSATSYDDVEGLHSSSKEWELTPTGYYKLHNEMLSWGDAWSVCVEQGGHLVVIDTPKEEGVVKSLISRLNASSTDMYYHAGVHDHYKEGQYTTVFDRPLSSTAFTWATGEPNGTSIQNCCGFNRNGQLHDITCYHTRTFLCEWTGNK